MEGQNYGAERKILRLLRIPDWDYHGGVLEVMRTRKFDPNYIPRCKHPKYKSGCADCKGESALHLAVRHNKAIAKMLLEKGADPNIRDSFGRTPIMGTDSQDMIKLLLDHGADINALDNLGENVLHKTNSPLAAERFLELGVDPTVVSKSGKSTTDDRLFSDVPRYIRDYINKKNGVEAEKNPCRVLETFWDMFGGFVIFGVVLFGVSKMMPSK